MAAAQQQMALQAQFGLSYQPLNLNVLAQNANMMHGYTFDGSAESASSNFSGHASNTGSHISHIDHATHKKTDDEQDQEDGKTK